jgi:peptidyl-dipeptidase Dcp
VFDVAGKLFGLKFVKRQDVAAYHPDVMVYEVREPIPVTHGANGSLENGSSYASGDHHANGHTVSGSGSDRLVAIFLHDNFSRPNKRSGAWMSELRSALPCDGIVPIILNNNNFSRGTGPTLLSFDDAKTLFHEFGHGCHGMLSKSKFNRLAGTNVLRDFVELPSQLMEHWLDQVRSTQLMVRFM